jgi:AcrR family transcriptional regulator
MNAPVDPGAHLEVVRPQGREAVRGAVIRCAAARFASDGPSASLRDIAADAGVNIGLIHRHVGNKDDLLREVLAAQGRVGAAVVGHSADPAAALEWMFANVATGGDYTRIVAWLLLGGTQGDYQQGYPTIDALRALLPPDADPVRLMAAMAMLYGWTVFGTQLTDAFGCDPADRAGLENRIGGLAAGLVSQG